MPYIHIPAEVLLQILAYVRNNGGPNSHLDLLSCSMVSRFWFDCAWPLVSEFFNQDTPLDLDAYSAAQIGCVADAIPTLRQLRVWKTTPFTSVVTTLNKLGLEQTAHGSHADAAVRFMHALQPPPKTLEIYIPNNFSTKNATNIQNFVSKFYSGTTSLRISGGYYEEPEEPEEPEESLEHLEPLEQLGILIHDLRHQLQHINIAGTYPPSFIRALSNCPNIRSVSIGFACRAYELIEVTYVGDLMATVFSWPELRSLKILGDPEDIDPIVEQLALNTPKHLESLHFDYCKTPQLHNLIISLAPRLVRLGLPSESRESSSELLALIASLDMPCLRYLDLSRLSSSLTAENVVQQHWVEGQSNPISLLRWPKLQRISLRLCFKISPLFLQLVMASCPALEGVRLGGNHSVRGKNVLTRSQGSEAILEDAGWTQSARTINYGSGCLYTKRTEVTFTRPGGNVWENEEWVEMKEYRVWERKFGRNDRNFRKFRESEMSGVVIVRCDDIGCENEFV